MTNELIARLSDDLRPTPANALVRGLAIATLLGLLASAALMLLSLGPRPDFWQAIGTPIFWIKSAYTAGLALAGIWATERLGRPGISGRMPLILAVGLLLALPTGSVVDYALAPVTARRAMLMGSSALVCPFYIAALSLPPFLAVIVLMRRLAPTNLPLAGAAVGLAAGALGGWVYSFHCTEEGLPFLALWYTTGVAAVAALGALLGRTLLRW